MVSSWLTSKLSHLKTNSKPILRSQLVKKNYIYSKYSIAFPVKFCFKENKIDEKNIWICSSQHNKNQCNKRKEINIFWGYCRCIFDIWYLFNISHCRLTWGSRKQPLDKTESIKWSTTEPPHYMYTYTYTYYTYTYTYTTLHI